MKKAVLVLLAALGMAWPAWGAEFSVSGGGTDPAARTYRVLFNSTRAVNDFTTPINACPTMSVTFFQATASDVSLYETDPDDDTLAEIEASTLVKAFTATSTSQHVFRPGKTHIRFVVDTAETSGGSIAIVSCINAVATADPIWRGFFKSAAGLAGALDSTACVQITDPYGAGGVTNVIDTVIGCTAQEAVLGFEKDTWISQIASLNVNGAGNAARGCSVCLSSDGTACDTGAEHDHPQNGENPTGSAVYTTDVDLFYPAGSFVRVMVGDSGSDGGCATPDCFCNSAAHEFWAGFYGRTGA